MTKEEATKELEILKEEYWDDDGYGHETQQYNDIMSALDMAIDALKQEPRWIPTSEMLPKETGWYYVTFEAYGGERVACELSYRKPENYWTDKNISRKVLDNNEVIAWMPKPKPYSEVKKDT